jgi:hypothetical protein
MSKNGNEDDKLKIDKAEEQLLGVTPEVDRGFYCNSVTVAHADTEFNIYFGHKSILQRKDEPAIVNVQAKIIINPSFVPRFIALLEQSYREYQESLNKTGEDNDEDNNE